MKPFILFDFIENLPDFVRAVLCLDFHLLRCAHELLGKFGNVGRIGG